MSFSISFPNSNLNSTDGELSGLFIKSFAFVEDINKMYAGAKLILKDVSASLRNSLYLGQDVTFSFVSSDSITYKNYMRILSIVPVTENQELVNELEVTLISNWYFENFTGTQMHTGSVGSIIRSICERRKKSRIFETYDILSTDDDIRIRYQTKEKTQDFMKRLIPFGTIQSMPVYLYSDCKGSFNLKGLSTFASSSAKIVFIPDLVKDLEETSIQAIANNGMTAIRLNDYHTTLALQGTTSREREAFLTSHFISTKDLTSSVTYHNAETSNAKIKKASPANYRCWNWNYLPQDAQALSSYDYFQTNINAFTLTGTFLGNSISFLNLGDKVRVLLPTSSSNINDILTSSASPNYIITHIERKYMNTQEITSFKGALVNYG